MQHPIRPEWLIRHANELAGRTAAAGKPRNTDLRRAQSAAYYALFHCITLSTARQVLPGATDDDQYAFSRHIQHGAVKRVCQWVDTESGIPPNMRPVVEVIRQREELASVAHALCLLQQRRHEADYSHLSDFSRPGVLSDIDAATVACKRLQDALETREAMLLLGYIAAASRIRNS